MPDIIANRARPGIVGVRPTTAPRKDHLSELKERFSGTAVQFLEAAEPQDTSLPGPAQTGPALQTKHQRLARHGKPMMRRAVVDERTRRGHSIQRR